MKRLTSFFILIIATVFLSSQLLASVQIAELTRHIPPRSPRALTGSQFIKLIRHLDSRQREQAVLHEILKGNIPTFLRRLVPVNFTQTRNGLTQTVIIFVLPDYLAIGSDEDFLRIPMNLKTATAVANRFGFLLPTRRIVDTIYEQSAYHFEPKPLPSGPQMSSTDYYRRHNNIIEAQGRRDGVVLGMLVSGHKKDVVITNLLAKTLERIAIYGWHWPDNTPIQPLSIIHGACYEDYSHGIRLVSEMALKNDTLRLVRDILRDPVESVFLSDEGPIR